MSKILLTLVTSMVAMFIMIGASFADGHCNKFADIKGKAWVDGDCMETPLGEKWWPHPIWGADDQAGSTNWYKKPEVVKRALAMVKKGNTMQLGHPYTASQPMFGARKFVLRIPGAPTGGAFGPNLNFQPITNCLINWRSAFFDSACLEAVYLNMSSF